MTKSKEPKEESEKVEKTIWEDIETSLDEVQGEENDNIIDDSDIGELEPEFEDNTSNINIDDEAESELDVYFKFGTNNHKLEGKHALKRDTILNGKINEIDELDGLGLEMYKQMGESDHYISDNPLEKGSIFDDESRNNEDSVERRNLSHDVYTLLKENTDIDFNANRRKTNKITFNTYYRMLLSEIGKTYTKSEIFVELAYYFTDNIFNMYKLLDKKYAIGIIEELKDKGYLSDLKSVIFM